MLEGKSSERDNGGLLWMVGISFAYLLVGILVFNLGEAVAKRRGSLARY